MLGQQSVTVIGGSNAAGDIDISSAGQIIGNITANGFPVANPNLAPAGLPCSGSFSGDGNGDFTTYLVPSDYSINVKSNGSTIGSFSVTATAGQTTKLGAIDFASGNVGGVLTWNGTQVQGSAVSAMFVSLFDSNNTNVNGTYLSQDGSYSLQSLPPGNYTAIAYEFGCSVSSIMLGQQSVTIVAGSTATANIDISSAGQIVGNITANGFAVANPILAPTGLPCGGSFSGDGTGDFTTYLVPRDYTINVNSDGSTIGSFSVTATAGQTTNLGAIDFASGNVSGVLTWNGAQLQGSAVSSMFVSLFDSNNTFVDGIYLSQGGSYSLQSLPPGDYTANAYEFGCSISSILLGQQSVTIVAGSTATANIDISSAGQIIGNITANGFPVANPILAPAGVPCGGSFSGDGTGDFTAYLVPGDYSINVSSNGSALGSFSISATAGQTTEYDNVVTSSGAQVSIAAAGGTSTIGGIDLIFATVSVSGTTTVLSSSVGPSAPDGFSVVGINGQPRYWAVGTTASFSGAISVCVRYDATQVDIAESDLKLEDATNGFADITASVNPSTHVICGTAVALSTFAVVE